MQKYKNKMTKSQNNPRFADRASQTSFTDGDSLENQFENDHDLQILKTIDQVKSKAIFHPALDSTKKFEI